MFRKLIALSAIATAAVAIQTANAAEWKPSGPITLNIGFGPGGSTDTMGRLIAQYLEKSKGWTVVPRNRPGGGGAVMAAGLIREKPDGLSLGMAVSESIILNIATRKNTPYKINSFDYLGTVTVGHLTIVAKKDAPFNNIAELVAFAKKNKNGATLGVNGKSAELIVRAIAKRNKVSLRPVPAKGGAEALKQILGGHTNAGFDGGRHMRYLKSGEVKVIATTNTARHPIAKDQPTLTEQGYEFSVQPWWFIAAPKGLPANVKSTLSAAIAEAIKSPKVKELVEKRFQLSLTNLGPEGTEKMMNEGLSHLEGLLKATR
ncbi:MAG: tripartite tricarboxylate transporter substrate binding protein [Hyphomicrobiales bacterium]|nr:tripartite tricarboxylate transporter substrate binding protein [Hyphomicrobiales bacterium]